MKNTPQQATKESLSNFIGLDYSKYDCYEVIQYFYDKVLGRKLEDFYTSRPDKETTQDMIKREKSEFLKVNKPQFTDLIVFNINGIACHIGMYIDNEIFFHTQKKTGSCVARLKQWEKRVVGYYRWPTLD